ncbi:MAG: hypothetical protein IT203_01625, partial [Fimbriimonadaceae bacterium]|nr:hypothetical protein [Fimbriimonadaceae bacterium]
MPNSWNEFTSEFQRLASRKLTERRIESILEDLHEHVDAAKCDPEFAGKSDREIESIVVARLGAPSDIIAAEQDSHRVAWLPVWVATAGLIWCASWLIAGHRILTLQMLPWGIYGTPIAVLLATLAGRRSKLWALLGATFGVALAMTIVLAFTWLNLYSVGGTGYLPRWQVDSATKEVQTLIDRQTTELRALEKAKAVYDRSDIEQARLLTYVAGKGWKAPSGSSSWPEVVEYQFGPTFASAAKIWKSRTGR